MPSKDVILTFSDSLPEIIKENLESLLVRSEELQENHQLLLKAVREVTKEKSFDRWFWIFYANLEFSEIFLVEKWVRYWIRLYEQLPGNEAASESKKYQANHLTDEEIQRAEQFPLEELYEGKLRKFGSRYRGLCPFHEEKTPSFFIFPDNRYHCFGCNAHGNPISFLMKKQHLSFPDAVRRLL